MSVVFPADMSKGAGKVLTATTYSDIFINTTAAAVGTPSTFQTNFNNSTFIGVLNQYDGVTSTGKFPVSATTFTATVPVFTNMISQDDMLNVIHAAAKIGGGRERPIRLLQGEEQLHVEGERLVELDGIEALGPTLANARPGSRK